MVVSSKQDDGEFTSHDDTVLKYKAWIPEEPRFLAIYLHGAAAHSGEAKNFADYISKNIGGAIFSFDQRGWGLSSDRKAGHIKSGSDVIDDVVAFLDFIRTKYNQYGDLPLILAGHSMGGLITLRMLLENQEDFTCAVISSPWIATRVEVPGYIRFFSSLISVIWPTFSDNLNIKIDELTHDNKMITQYYKEIEEGIRRTKGTARWYVEMTKMQNYVYENAQYITLPTLIMQAGQDLIVKESASKDVFSGLGCDIEDKEWQYYPNLYHELWNEEGRETTTLPEVATFINRYVK